MTEDIFKELGFERNDISIEQSGHDTDFYYYTLDIGDITFISNANDDAEKEGWWCSIFDSMTLKIQGSGDLEELVKIVKLNTNETA